MQLYVDHEAANELLVHEARSYINSSFPCALFAAMPLIPTSKISNQDVQQWIGEDLGNDG